MADLCYRIANDPDAPEDLRKQMREGADNFTVLAAEAQLLRDYTRTNRKEDA